MKIEFPQLLSKRYNTAWIFWKDDISTLLKILYLIIAFTRMPRLAWNLIRLTWKLIFDRRISIFPKLIIPAVLIYFLSPIDLVPDILPVLGHLDDILIILPALIAFFLMIPKNIISEHTQNTKSSKKNTQDTIIDGSYHYVDDDSEDQQSPEWI